MKDKKLLVIKDEKNKKMNHFCLSKLETYIININV